jgi:Leucine-rich repeat (LRR) protein
MKFMGKTQPTPSTLGMLTKLETLVLTTTPNFPNVTHLTSVKTLIISFEEPLALPDSIGDMAGLEYLQIYESMHGMSLPASFGYLTNLTYLKLDHAGFVGNLPTTMGSLSALKEVSLMGNGFTGLLPMDSWPLITMLNAASNKFDALPSTAATMDHLVSLILDDNLFSGPLPAWIGDMTSLRILCIKENGFTSLPSSIGNVTTLEILTAASNALVSIPIELGNLHSMHALDLTNNDFSSAPFNSSENRHSIIFDVISEMPSLSFISLTGCHLSGTIPESVAGMPSMKMFYAGSNAFTGDIPASIRTAWPNIQAIDLTYNQLDGTVPGWLSEFSGLHVLGLRHNRFSGNIPDALSQIKVAHLDLSHNLLNGTIPYAFGEAPHLSVLDFSYNELSGTIPISFNRSAPSTYFSVLNLSYNRLTFCPSEIHDFPYYLAVSGICDFRGQKQQWTRPYDCGCAFDAFDRCWVDYPLEQCVPCASPPPSSTANFECQHGQWVLIGENPSLSNTSLTIGGNPVVIPGNLSSSPVTFEGLNGVLTVSGCADITNITLVLSLPDIEKLISLPATERAKLLVKSTKCRIENVPIQIISTGTHSCATVSASTASGGNSLTALFNVDKSKCEKSKWWVILVSVVCALIILVGAAALTFFLIKRNKEKQNSKRITTHTSKIVQ